MLVSYLLKKSSAMELIPPEIDGSAAVIVSPLPPCAVLLATGFCVDLLLEDDDDDNDEEGDFDVEDSGCDGGSDDGSDEVRRPFAEDEEGGSGNRGDEE